MLLIRPMIPFGATRIITTAMTPRISILNPEKLYNSCRRITKMMDPIIGPSMVPIPPITVIKTMDTVQSIPNPTVGLI